MAFFLDADGFIHSCDQILVCFFECFDIYNAAFRFFRHIESILLEDLGVFQQQCIGRICDVALQLQRFLLSVESESHYHLALPQGNGFLDGSLDLIGEQFVVVLDEPDLRSSLEGDCFACLQVVYLFLKLIYSIFEIPDELGVHGIPAFLHFGAQRRDRLLPEFFYLFIACRDVDLKLFEIVKILLVERVEHTDVLEHFHTCFLQFPFDTVYLYLELFILGEIFFYFCFCFPEDAEDA